MSFDYPVFLTLKKKKCVVIGGGKVATRKVSALLKSEADVTVIAPRLTTTLQAWQAKKKIRCFQRPFRPSDLEGAWLVITATNDPLLNETVSSQAQRRRQWINVVDQPSLCQLIFPSVIKKGDLTLAISTNGKSPALAKAIRQDLGKNFIPNYEESLKKIAEERPTVLKNVSSIEKRRQLLNHMAKELVGAGRD